MLLLTLKILQFAAQRTTGCEVWPWLFCVDGRFFAVETKRLGADLTDIQKDTRDDICFAGGIVYKVDNAVSCVLMIADIKRRIANG